MTATSSATDPIRQRIIDQCKAEIANGTFETPERIDAATDKLLADLVPSDSHADAVCGVCDCKLIHGQCPRCDMEPQIEREDK